MTWSKNLFLSAAILIFRLCCAPLVWGEDTALQLGRELAALGSYNQAVTEYKRFICFSTDAEAQCDSYRQIALAYRAEEKWDEAIAAYQTSLSLAPGDSLRDDLRIQMAVTLIAAQRYSSAEFALLRVHAFGKYAALKHKAGFFLGVAALYTAKWDAAREYFADYFSDQPGLRSRIVDSLLAPTKHPRQRSPATARRLSTLLPGSGQVYAGSLRHGLNSLALNLGTAYLLGSSIADQRYYDAAFVHFSLFWRYYSGSRYHAARICQKRNLELNREYAARVLRALDDLLD
ncbi:tetratricopeptide repeat protein [Candidatus Zixiibacteriota bacterium]